MNAVEKVIAQLDNALQIDEDRITILLSAVHARELLDELRHLPGTNERCQILLRYKYYWAERARLAENTIAALENSK